MRKTLILLTFLVGCAAPGSQPRPPLAVQGEAGTPATGATGSVRLAPLASGTFTLVGVTRDDVAVVRDRVTSAIHVVPLDGGPATVIAATAADVRISGTTVLVWSVIDPSISAGPLSAWTRARGTTFVAWQAIAGMAAASSDGGHLLYFVADGYGAANMIESNDDARTLRMAGVTPLHVDYTADDLGLVATKGAAGAELRAFDGTGERLVASNVADFLLDSTRQRLLVVRNNGMTTMAPSAGEAGTLITNAAATAAFAGNGVIYLTKSGDLGRWPVSGAAILARDVDSIADVSPDGNHVLYRPAAAPDDLRMADNASTQPLAMSGELPPAVHAFTADSAWLVMADNREGAVALRLSSLDGTANYNLAWHSSQLETAHDGFIAWNERNGDGTSTIRLLDTRYPREAIALTAAAQDRFALDHEHARVVYVTADGLWTSRSF